MYCSPSPSPPPARQVGHPCPEAPLPARRPRSGGEGMGTWAIHAIPPPLQKAIFLPRCTVLPAVLRFMCPFAKGAPGPFWAWDRNVHNMRWTSADPAHRCPVRGLGRRAPGQWRSVRPCLGHVARRPERSPCVGGLEVRGMIHPRGHASSFVFVLHVQRGLSALALRCNVV